MLQIRYMSPASAMFAYSELYRMMRGRHNGIRMMIPDFFECVMTERHGVKGEDWDVFVQQDWYALLGRATVAEVNFLHVLEMPDVGDGTEDEDHGFAEDVTSDESEGESIERSTRRRLVRARREEIDMLEHM